MATQITIRRSNNDRSNKPAREKRNFSKVILGAVMVLYFLGALFGGYEVFMTNYGLEALLSYIGAPTATAIGFYAWKAKNENCKKIGGNFADNYMNTGIPVPTTGDTPVGSEEELKG